MELSERNPLLANANVEVERVACKSTTAAPEPGPIHERSEADASGQHEDPLDTGETEDDLEEFETGLYLCRWPNGEFSLVKADDRKDKDAVVQLDEWAGAEPAWLVPVDTCMVDFRLNDRGKSSWPSLERKRENSFGGNCYPGLNQVLSSEEVPKHSGRQAQPGSREQDPKSGGT